MQKASDAFQAAQQAEMESVMKMAQTALSGFEKLTALQLQQLRETSEEAARAMRAALSARDPSQWMDAQAGTDALQQGGEKMLSYAQNVAQIASATQAEMAKAFGQSMNRVQEALRAAMEQGMSGVPGSSDTAQGLMDNALAFTNQAIEAMQKSQTEAARMLTEQMQAATKAGGAAGARRKR